MIQAMIKELYNRQPEKIVETIPVFSADTYWGKSSEHVLNQALDCIQQEGWDQFYKKFGTKFDVTQETNRADWRFNVPLNKDFVVLDTGAGMGRISIPLARVVKQVVAFDSSVSRMRYLALRAQKEGLHNIEVCVANFFDLPFAPESFDLIVMNGVLEWVSKTPLYKNPRQAQIVALEICRKLLKPGGYLYIGIENRWAASYLRGYDHSGLRFTSYLPRLVASWYTRLRGKGPYDTYTYSRAGYIRLLRQAGFLPEKISFYLPYPGYNLPRVVFPYEALPILKYLVTNVLTGRNTKRRLIQKLVSVPGFLRLYRWFFFSYNIIVRK